MLFNDARLDDAYFDAVDTLEKDEDMKEVLLSLARWPWRSASLIPHVMRGAVMIRHTDERSGVKKAFDVQ